MPSPRLIALSLALPLLLQSRYPSPPMADLLPALEIGPEGEADGAVVWLHGLGASGYDFEELVPLLGLPHVRFVLPHAPSRAVTINGGLIMPAWYDILILGALRGGERAEHVRHSAELVEALIRREEERGVATSRIVLAGFSQGGAMALHVGVRYPKPLAGILVLSGYEVLADTRESETSEANRTTPMLFAHGRLDPMVALERGRAAYDACAEGRKAEWHDFPMAHEVSMEEVRVVRRWLGERFGSTE